VATCGCALAQKSDVLIAGPDIRYFNMEIGPGDKVVKGAPYTADAVTETVQTLANGTHIVHKSTAQLARDSEGRTRREQTVDVVGPWSTSGEAPKFITLTDPVAGVTYHLDPKNSVAVKFPSGKSVMPPPAGPSSVFFEPSPDGQTVSAGVTKIRAEAAMTSRLTAAGIAAGPGAIMSLKVKEPSEAKSESLGQQTIEGLQATGTRTTRIIAAGVIGNDQPIDIVSETWYSPELQMVVMSKHSDPQIGETTYRLTNIQRGAPPQSLFEVPATYTVREEKDLIVEPLPPSSATK
jgi:hypothetical protein